MNQTATGERFFCPTFDEIIQKTYLDHKNCTCVRMRSNICEHACVFVRECIVFLSPLVCI